MHHPLFLVAAITLGCAASPPLLAAPPLPAYKVAAGSVAVAGVSSGGFMAVQLHVAYSATFSRGGAVFAGGPYDCANGRGLTAATECMAAFPKPPDAGRSIRTAKRRAQAGEIDPLANLAGSRAYLFSGTNDMIVRQAVVDALAATYRHWLPAANVVYDNATPAAHAWVSTLAPQRCETLGRLFLNDCGIDPVRTFLTQFYGPLQPRNDGPALRGSLIEFDQTEFFDDRDPGAHSVADSGWAFVPKECAAGQPCRAIVALHGCLQDHARVGDAFVRRTGLNEWADANRMVVVYPQAMPKVPKNPSGCWDWWGYDDAAYATRQGRQMRAVKGMVDRIMGLARRG